MNSIIPTNLNIVTPNIPVNTNTTNNKTPFLKNFTQFFKKGSNALGDKVN